MTPLTLEERETIIRRSMVDKHWDVWTDDPNLRRKLARLGYQPTEEGEGFYRLPLQAVSVRRYAPAERTEAQKASMARLKEFAFRARAASAAANAQRPDGGDG